MRWYFIHHHHQNQHPLWPRLFDSVHIDTIQWMRWMLMVMVAVSVFFIFCAFVFIRLVIIHCSSGGSAGHCEYVQGTESVSGRTMHILYFIRYLYSQLQQYPIQSFVSSSAQRLKINNWKLRNSLIINHSGDWMGMERQLPIRTSHYATNSDLCFFFVYIVF